MSRNKGVLRSLYLQSNSLSLLSSALRLYLQNNFFSLLSFDGVIGRLTLLYLRLSSSPPTLLPSSLSSKLLLLLLLLLLSSSSLLSTLFLSLSSLAWSSSSFAWPRSCFSFASLILSALTWLNKFAIIGFWITNFFASLNVTLNGIGHSKTHLFFLI